MTITEDRRAGRPRSEEVDRAIIAATVDLLGEGGYFALTMESVAARASVAKTSVYRRYADKDALVFEALSRVKGSLSVPTGGTVRDDLVHVLEHMRRRWTGTSTHARLMRRLITEAETQPERYDEFRRRLVAKREAVITDIIDRGIAEGSIRSDVDRHWVMDLLVSPMVACGLTHRGQVNRAQLEFTVDTVLAGLRPSNAD